MVRAHQGLSAGNGGISVLSSDSWAIDKGGQIVFGGAISASDTSRTFGLIGGYKENTTDGNRAGYLQFGVREGTGAKDIVERMRIASEGNVGIGTIAPAETLHIDGTARIKPGTTGYFNFEGQGNLSVRMKNSSGNMSIGGTSIIFEDQNSNTARMRMYDTGGFAIGSTYHSTDPGANNVTIEGKVGIGTTNPGYQLHVDGTGILGLVSTMPYIEWNEEDAAADMQKWVARSNAGAFQIQTKLDAGATIDAYHITKTSTGRPDEHRFFT